VIDTVIGGTNKSSLFCSLSETSTHGIELDDVNITECSAESSEIGGAVSIVDGGRSGMKIKNLKFESCDCMSEVNGTGGAIYLWLNGGPTNLNCLGMIYL
jgi:hypothetical protein